MKTVQSFFPTTTKSKASFKKDTTYKVMKKIEDDNFLQPPHSQPRSKFSEQLHIVTPKAENIFRDKFNSVKNYSLDENIQRPIGGIELFRKMQKANHLNIEESTRRLSKKGSRKNIKESREKIGSNQSRSHHHVGFPEKGFSPEKFKDETFKQHTDIRDKYTTHLEQNGYGSKSVGKYQSELNGEVPNLRKCSTSQEQRGYRNQRKYSSRVKQKGQTLNQTGKSSSVQSLCNTSSPESGVIQWASEQERNYLDKMAILNEINYNRPLIEKLGGKYFECMLRNRYMDEPEFNHKSPFIYQIKEKLSDTKFISKIKSMKCNLLERNKIVVKGRNKMAKQQQDKMDAKDARKRWQEWNEDSFQG